MTTEDGDKLFEALKDQLIRFQFLQQVALAEIEAIRQLLEKTLPHVGTEFPTADSIRQFLKSQKADAFGESLLALDRSQPHLAAKLRELISDFGDQ